MKNVNIYAYPIETQPFSTISHQGRRLKMDYAHQLIKEIDLLIENDNTSFESLDDLDKDTLVTLMMKSRKQNAYECLTDSNNLMEITEKLNQFIYFGSNEIAKELADLMRESAIQFYASDLTQIYDERFQSIQSDTHYENGLKPIQDQTNGEITWMRA